MARWSGPKSRTGWNRVATARDELTALKLRALHGEREKRVTLVDHTAKTTQSSNVAEAIAFLANLVEKGKGLNSIHVVDLEAEKERKLTNPKGSTRRVFNCRTPDQWKKFNEALEPYYDGAQDPHIAIDLIIKALTAFSPQTIADWVKQETAGEPEWPDFLQEPTGGAHNEAQNEAKE